jgi:hypothetical protein
MAYSYFFFAATRLPLTAADLGEDTVVPLTDAAAVKAALTLLFPDIEWVDEAEGRLQRDGRWLEFHPGGEAGTLSLRCSLRADYRDIVQHICDELGWLAFDESPLCYQPRCAPMPV